MELALLLDTIIKIINYYSYGIKYINFKISQLFQLSEKTDYWDFIMQQRYKWRYRQEEWEVAMKFGTFLLETFYYFKNLYEILLKIC